MVRRKKKVSQIMQGVFVYLKKKQFELKTPYFEVKSEYSFFKKINA